MTTIMAKADAIMKIIVTGVAAALSFILLAATAPGAATHAANIQPPEDKILVQSTTQSEVTGNNGTLGYGLSA
jgi:hypothetical protein